jgi:hypothetical protein
MDTRKDDEPTAVIGSDYAKGEFQSRLLACCQAIDELVLGLAARYDLVVILRALAEHTGTGLLALVQRGTGGALQARHLINRMESNTFRNGITEHHHEE